MPSIRTRILLILIGAILAASFASIIIRLTPAPTLVIAAGRMVFAALILTPFFSYRFSKYCLEITRARLLWILASGIFLAAHFVCWIESLRHTTVSSSVILVAMNPIFVAILSPLILKEKISWQLGLAITVGVIGTLIITRPALSSATNLTGNLLALAGAFFAALYVIMGRKLRHGLSLLGYVYPVYFTAALILTAIALIAGYRLLSFSLQTYLFIFLLAIGPQIIGHTGFNWALAYLPAPVVAMTILGEPVGTTVLATIILRQPPSMFEIAGGALILFAIYLAATSFSSATKNGAPS